MTTDNNLTFGDLTLDMVEGIIHGPNGMLFLTGREFRVFREIMRANGGSASYELLAEAGRKSERHYTMSHENIRQAIFTLRNNIRKCGSKVLMANRKTFGWRLVFPDEQKEIQE